MFETILSMWEGYVLGNDLMINFGFGFINTLVTGVLEGLVALSEWVQNISIF